MARTYAGYSKSQQETAPRITVRYKVGSTWQAAKVFPTWLMGAEAQAQALLEALLAEGKVAESYTWTPKL